MKPLSFFLFFPLAAQISTPQLGFVSHRGELRRVEGLSHSSRLSAPLAGLPACSRLDAGVRYAICLNEGKASIIDLNDFSVKPIEASYERVAWSPSGYYAALDSQVFDLARVKSTGVEGTVAAVSDLGTVALRDARGAVSLRGEPVAGPETAAVAFDGEALLVSAGLSILRLEPGRSSQEYALGFEARFVASDASAIYAANARAVARVDRSTGEVSVYEVPADDVEISRLERLLDGSFLVVRPAENQPGWLFRNGRFSFIPGIAMVEEVAQ